MNPPILVKPCLESEIPEWEALGYDFHCWDYRPSLDERVAIMVLEIDERVYP